MACDPGKIIPFILFLYLWVGGAAAYPAAVEVPQDLDRALQQAKRDMLELEERIRQLSGGQFGLETVSVYVSVDEDISFRLEKVKLKLDGKTVSEFTFYSTRQQALRQGGAAPVYSGTLVQGKHRIEAIFSVTGKDGKQVEYREQWTLDQQPGRHTMVELRLGNAIFRQAPAIDMRMVD